MISQAAVTLQQSQASHKSGASHARGDVTLLPALLLPHPQHQSSCSVTKCNHKCVLVARGPCKALRRQRLARAGPSEQGRGNDDLRTPPIMLATSRMASSTSAALTASSGCIIMAAVAAWANPSARRTSIRPFHIPERLTLPIKCPAPTQNTSKWAPAPAAYPTSVPKTAHWPAPSRPHRVQPGMEYPAFASRPIPDPHLFPIGPFSICMKAGTRVQEAWRWTPGCSAGSSYRTNHVTVESLSLVRSGTSMPAS